MCHILGKIGQIYGTKNAHGKIHGLKKRILEYILSRYFIVTKYLLNIYRMNIEYIKTAFSADCSKNFDGKNMVQIMGKICPIYVPYFAHGVFTLKVSERFQFTLPYGEWPWMIRPSRPFNFNSHSYAGVITRLAPKIILLHDSFSYPV